MHGYLVPHVVHPVMRKLSFLGPAGWIRQSDFLHRAQWDTAEEIQHRMSLRLRSLVTHAYENVAWYRELFDKKGIVPRDISSIDDLENVPVTKRSDIVDNYPDRMAAGNMPERLRLHRYTSGSTGSPMYFFKDPADITAGNAANELVRTWNGVNVWDRRIKIGSPGFIYRHYHFRDRVLEAVFGQKSIPLSCMDSTYEDLLDAVRSIPARRRYYIWGYTSYLAFWASQMYERGVRPDRLPFAVLAGADAMNDMKSDIISRVFGCRPMVRYGCRELGNIAIQCPDNPGLMHVPGEHLIVRIVDQKGGNVRPGVSGRVVLTSLSNRVMPFINYDIQDRAVAGEKCSCGRGYTTIRCVEGRAGEVIRLPGGGVVAEAVINPVLRTSGLPNGVMLELQMVQTAADSVELHVVPSRMFRSKHRVKLEEHFARILGSEMKVKVRTVDHIETYPSGKRPLIVPLEKTNAEKNND